MTLYVKSGCPWCDDAEEWLRARSLSYERVDVLRDEAGFARMRLISGQSLAPTLELGDGSVLADFDVGQLADFLRERS
jgi:glutaredoxin